MSGNYWRWFSKWRWGCWSRTVSVSVWRNGSFVHWKVFFNLTSLHFQISSVLSQNLTDYLYWPSLIEYYQYIPPSRSFAIFISFNLQNGPNLGQIGKIGEASSLEIQLTITSQESFFFFLAQFSNNIFEICTIFKIFLNLPSWNEAEIREAVMCVGGNRVEMANKPSWL